MKKLSRQKEIIVSTLRDLRWHCGSEWLSRIKDDRKRCSELNETGGYMTQKGYKIIGEPCNGSACGRRNCPLYKRKAVKITELPIQHRPKQVYIKGMSALKDWTHGSPYQLT